MLEVKGPSLVCVPLLCRRKHWEHTEGGFHVSASGTGLVFIFPADSFSHAPSSQALLSSLAS